MVFSKKNVILFISLVVFGVILFFPKTSLARDTDTKHYIDCTFPDCGEDRTEECGYWRWKECETCCDTCYDDEGEPYDCDCERCCPCCRHYSCIGSWTQFKATGEDCAPEVLRRVCKSVRGSEDCSNCCKDCGEGGCTIRCGVWERGDRTSPSKASEVCEECKDWQRAVLDSCENPDSTEWCTDKPPCECCGCPGGGDCDPEESCVEPPDGLQEYESLDNSVPVEGLAKLPVRFDWNDVPGWYAGGGGSGGNDWDAYHTCWDDNFRTCWNSANEAHPEAMGCCGWLMPYVVACLKAKCDELSPLNTQECEDRCPAAEEEDEEDEETSEECYRGEESMVQSYVLEIRGELRNCDNEYDIEILGEEGAYDDNYDYEAQVYRAVLTDRSEFLPPCPCFFKPGRRYEWKVRACCTADGENCGPWSEKRVFNTSRAPEPIYPSDPDWQGEGARENLSYEDSRELQWCHAEDPSYYYPTGPYYSPLSYKVLINYFKEDAGEYVCHPLLLTEEGICRPAYLELEEGEDLPPEKFTTWGFVSRDSAYSWQVAACRDEVASDCTPYSQEWKFSTKDWDIGIALSNPRDDADRPIGLPVRIAWSSAYANSFKYKIYEGEVANCNAAGPLVAGSMKDYELMLYHESVADPFAILELNTIYTWCVQPCRDFNTEDCEDYWGGPWHFKTTGQPPVLDTMKPDGEGLTIPQEFTWQKVGGAKSYWFKIDSKEPVLIPAEKAKIELDYPDLVPETSYSWRVRTCADVEGEICGVYSNAQTFTTFEWEAPSGPDPADGDEVFPPSISWEKVDGARFYKYRVTFLALDEDDPRQEECEEEINKITDQEITRQHAVNLSLGLKCWGEYEWSVIPCLDENCEEYGPESVWHFYFKSPVLPEEESAGLIPCNQVYNNPDTEWDETDSCGIKHLFIIIYVMVNFLFIRVLPMILVLLVLASGVIIYFSRKMEAPNPIAKVKSLWKAAGIGIALLLFSWLITSFLLTLVGYKLPLWNLLGV